MDKQIHFVRSLSSDLKNVLHEYQAGSLVNYNLRLKLSLDQWDDLDRDIFEKLEQIFNTIPPIDQAITVYRGIAIYEDEKFDTYNGAFISTTIEPYIAKRFIEGLSDCCILQITISPNSRIIPIFAEKFTYNEEAEVILDRKGEFMITGRQGNVIYVTYLPKPSVKVVSDRAIIKYFQGEKEGSETCVIS